MNNNDLISIIVPAYNVEKYIENCINSLIGQTYKNIEVLIIDDGSKDKTGDICKKMALLDDRIKYFYKENSGVADTRNYGLNVTIGQYFTFVDSDDFVSKQYIELLYNALVNNSSDIAICRFKNFFELPKITLYEKIENCINYNTEESLLHFFLQDTIDASFWGKMYKKEIFKDIVINNYKVFEDMDTMYKLLLKSNKVTCISNVLYYYFVRNDSLIHKKFNNENAKVIQILDNMRDPVLEKYPTLEDALLIRKINAHFYVVRNVEKSSLLYSESKKFIVNNRKKVLKISYLPIKTKVGIYISFISIALIKPIFKIYDRVR